MTIRNTLLASGAALLLSAGAAIAAPATAQTDLSVRAGPGVQYPVVGSIQGGETVDVGGCTGSWCQVSFSGGSGYANRSYLAMAGGPGVGIAAEQYYVGDPAYAYDDSDYGYAYGPGVGFYAGPRFHHRRSGWNGNSNGRPGWNGNHVGTWQGRSNFNGNRIGNAAPSFNRGAAAPSFNRGAIGGRASMSAPAGLRAGSVSPMGGARTGGAPHISGGAPHAGPGRGQH